MPLRRLDSNPLLSPDDLRPTRDDLEVFCTLNPGAARIGGEIVLVVRVGERPREEPGTAACVLYDAAAGEVAVRRFRHGDPDLVLGDARGFTYRGRAHLTSLSHLRVARSTDGVHFAFDAAPALFPATPYEAFGCEDPRVTFIEGRYYITYTAVSDRGVAVGLAATEDFRNFVRLGVMLPPSNKDVCLFPRRVRDLYVCRHRPSESGFNPASIWTAYSPDFVSWGRHEMTLAPTPGTWEGGRVGCGPPPVWTPEGWLEIYHAADERGRYCLGAILSDLRRPERVLARSSRPVLEPEAPYELAGIYGHCVFSNGLVVGDDGAMTVYYGAADRISAGAVTTVDEMIAAARA